MVESISSSTVEAIREERFDKIKILVSDFFVVDEVLFGDLKCSIESGRTVCQLFSLSEKSDEEFTYVRFLR